MAMPKGHKHTKETKLKMSASQRKFFGNPENIKRLREKRKRLFRERPELLENLKSASKKSKKFGGKKHSEESKRKIGLAMKGRKRSKESLLKSSRSQKGRLFSEESRKKMSEGQRKYFSNPESRIKCKIVQRKRFERESERIKMTESRVGGFWYGNVRYPTKQIYCEKFNEDLKNRVRLFFNNECIECGSPQNGKALHIHHVHYNRRLCCDESPRTLVPLCNSCHAKTNINRKYWSQHFQEMIDMYYGGKCWLSKEEASSIRH